MAEIVRIEGLKDLDAALAELPRATARNTLKRALMKGADMVEAAAQQNAPEDTGKLDKSIVEGSRLTRRQAAGERRDGKSFASVYVGTSLSRGIFTEFGTFKDRAQMWFTRAWEATKSEALDAISKDLGTEIEKSAARLARKRARGN